MPGSSDGNEKPIFEIVPGKSIGPFHLGMPEAQVSQICREIGIRRDLHLVQGGMRFSFEDDKAVSIEVPAEFEPARLALAGAELKSLFNEDVRALLAKIVPLSDKWTEPEGAGIAIFHWEMTDREVFSFLVFLPGHRY